MMTRKILILVCFLAVSASLAAPAAAREKSSWFSWPFGHDEWTDAKKFQPYLENSKHPHNTQWADRDWYAEDWIGQRRNGMTLIKGFYDSDIFRNQEMDDDGVPTLVVGPNFYHLSGYDKRRVVHSLDVVYGVTRSRTNGSIILKDWYTKRTIGQFTQQGLQLQ